MIPIVIPYPVSIEKKDVNFYDYDGTLLYSYTTAQAQALSALPSAPNHSGNEVPLTFQGWNYTLEQINAVYYRYDVGATYIPTDGKTHFIVRVTAVTGGSVPFYFTKSNATDTLSIDYGDGQTASDSTNTAVTFTPATALAIGDHHVTVWLSSGEGTYSLGQGSSTTTVVGGENIYYRNTLLRCYIGESITSIGAYAFASCFVLETVTIPNAVTGIDAYALQSVRAIKCIIIPNGVTSIGDHGIYSCTALSTVSIPMSVTSIGASGLSILNSMRVLIIPGGVSNISSRMLSCASGRTLEFDFASFASVPTLASDTFFGIIPTTIFVVPASLYSEWIAATNWATQANRIVAV